MVKKIGKLDLGVLRHRGVVSGGEGVCVGSDVVYADDSVFIALHAFRVAGMENGQPYQVGEGRLMLVREGRVRVVVNLEEFELCRHSAMLLTAESIIEIEESSLDFDMMAFSFKDLPLWSSPRRQVCFLLSDDDWALSERYFDLLWHSAHRGGGGSAVIGHLQTALLTELSGMTRRGVGVGAAGGSRQESLLHGFLELVNVYGLTERRIGFYADRLCLSPNYLGAVIRQSSGLTVVEWLNRYAVQQAKLLLRYTDLRICEVADRLHFATPSFFTKFFKKETGMTPGVYKSRLTR